MDDMEKAQKGEEHHQESKVCRGPSHPQAQLDIQVEDQFAEMNQSKALKALDESCAEEQSGGERQELTPEINQ